MNEELLEMAMSGRHAEVARLLEVKANIETQDRAGYTPISEAASAGHAIVVGQLFRAFADPDRPAQDGRTALHRACFHNWTTVVTLMLENGANADLLDEDGKKPIDLVRTGVMRELLLNFDREKNKQSAAEKRQQRENLTNQADLSEDENDEALPTSPRKNEAENEALPTSPRKNEAENEAEKEATRRERDRRYEEAMAELKAQSGEAECEANLPTFAPCTARVRVVGAGEKAVNGIYAATFVSKGQVEFEKLDDKNCQISWSDYQHEWRMIVGNYKMGSTLYRHKYKPNTKADDRLGIPRKGWQIWFGKEPAPNITFLPDLGSNEAVEDAVAEDASLQNATEDEPIIQPVRVVNREYMELNSSLTIVDPKIADRDCHRAVAPDQSKRFDVSLNGGERLIETADGLFGADEICDENAADSIAELDNDQLATAWLENADGIPPVSVAWNSVTDAKNSSQGLFADGKFAEAQRSTTAILRAAEQILQFVEDPSPEDELPIAGGHLPNIAEVDKLIGVLHSNRALILLQRIQSADEEVLKFSLEVAWSLVVKEAGKALVVDPSNFKASFRRARGFFELGELESALADANRVVDHYDKHSSTPNPEAAALRDRILEAIQKEKRKWGQNAPSRWNRGTHEPLVTEVDSTSTSTAAKARLSAMREPEFEKIPFEVLDKVRAKPAKAPPAPKTAGDVEKVLLGILRNDDARKLAYVKEHITAANVSKFYARSPLNPDLLAALLGVLESFSEDDSSLVGDFLLALANLPSTSTAIAMFDSEEQAILRKLLERSGGKVADKWALFSAVE